MFPKTEIKKTRLDEAIDSLFDELAGLNADSDEYAKMVTQLERLYEIKNSSNKEKKDRVSKDTLATVFANLAGIGMILGYERVNVVTSKALSFVMKAR